MEDLYAKAVKLWLANEAGIDNPDPDKVILEGFNMHGCPTCDFGAGYEFTYEFETHYVTPKDPIEMLQQCMVIYNSFSEESG